MSATHREPTMPVATRMAARRDRTRLGQVGVMDRGLAAVLAAAAVLGLISVYFYNARDTLAENEYAQINTIAMEVAKLYDNKASSYDGLTTAVIAQSGSLPASWTNPEQTQIMSVYNSPIEIQPSASDSSVWAITLRNIPQSACAFLATSKYGANTMFIETLDASLDMNSPDGNDPALATAMCRAAATKNYYPIVNVLILGFH